jgi:hypothetical protein
MTEKTVTYQDMDVDVDAIREPKDRSMIEFKVDFSTDHINGQPRQCWSSGKVTRSANHGHGIQYGERNVNTIAEIGPAIEDLAAEAEITIHPSEKAKAYRQHHDIDLSWEAKAYARDSDREDDAIVWG